MISPGWRSSVGRAADLESAGRGFDSSRQLQAIFQNSVFGFIRDLPILRMTAFLNPELYLQNHESL